ncbi:M1 family aminopeptidase [Chryseobacterium sp. SIMBA_038]
MRKTIFWLAIFLAQCFYAQTSDQGIKSFRKNEMKSAAHKLGAGGNPNPNTLNYDLRYQRMDVSLDPAVQNISGSVTSHFIPNQNINSIYFDLSSLMTVSQVQYHGINLNFQSLSATKELKIDFPISISANVLDSLTINYSGSPTTSLLLNPFSTGVQNGTPVLSTFNQLFGAQEWFPTKVSLNDKIERFDFKITTPSQYNVAANGKLMSETSVPNGKKLTFWRTMYPTASYVVGISITNFVKLSSTIGNPPFPFVNYVYPNTAANTTSMTNIEWTKQIMATFENYFGPYPFRDEKYGHMEFLYNYINLETQTMSSMSSWEKYLIAHELAHQWFGNKVTCGTPGDLWLNEAFATFGEHLANEKLLMNNTEFLNYLLSEKNYCTSFTNQSVATEDYYSRGAYMVRMMKWVLGDAVFYQALRDYQSNPNFAYKYVVAQDLKGSLLQSTGKDFTEFFNDWVYGKGYPTYTIKWKQMGNQITFKASQSQSNASVSFFDMILPIKVTGNGGEVAYFALNNTSNNQYFTQSVSFPVASVQFNYEYQILEKNSTVTLDNTLGTAETDLDNFSVYPNPASYELNVKGVRKSVDYKIYFSDGKIVKEGVYQVNKPINISELIPGVYFLNINENRIKLLKK